MIYYVSSGTLNLTKPKPIYMILTAKCTIVGDHWLALFGLKKLLLPSVPSLACSLWTWETPPAGCTIVGLFSLDLTPPAGCTVVEDLRLALFGLARLSLPGVPLSEIIGLLSSDLRKSSYRVYHRWLALFGLNSSCPVYRCWRSPACSLWTCETPSARCTIVGDHWLALFGLEKLLLPSVPSLACSLWT